MPKKSTKPSQKSSADKSDLNNNMPTKLPSVWQLLKMSWFEISTFWRPLFSITLVYAALYFIFVMGLSLANGLQPADYSSEPKLLQVAYSVIDSISQTSSGSQSDATILLQAILFTIASLAILWALRRLRAVKPVSIRDAYYQGTASLVPVVIVCFLLLLCLLPALLGASILTVALQVTNFGAAIVIAFIAALLLMFLTMLIYAMFWPAFYIASLPNIRPIQAFKSAAQLTKKRRLAITRKIVALLIIVVIIFFVVVVPFALISNTITPYAVYAMLFALFLGMQVYLYELYRSMI